MLIICIDKKTKNIMPELILDQIVSKERQFTPKIEGPLKRVDQETRITSSLYNFLNNGEDRKRQIADNLSIGIDATEEEFRAAFDRKQQAIFEFYEVANENLGSAKEEILRFVGVRLGAEHRALIESRLDDVQEVAVADAIVEGGGLPRINGLAHFDHPSGEFVLAQRDERRRSYPHGLHQRSLRANDEVRREIPLRNRPGHDLGRWQDIAPAKQPAS